jgi:hypothetical protein
LKKTCLITGFVLLLLTVIIGCSHKDDENSSPTASDPILDQISRVNGVESAVLNIFSISDPDRQVDVHAVTADWDETTVTWNSFAAAYETIPVTSFTTDSTLHSQVDITSLVDEWAMGTRDNFGILLNQTVPPFPFSEFVSSNSLSSTPYVIICRLEQNFLICDTIMIMMDTYIYEAQADSNFGASGVLITGLDSEAGLNHQSLLKFEVPEIPLTSGIGDFVFYDENMDGIQDSMEVGVPDVAVKLYSCVDSGMVAHSITDTGGYYAFLRILPGSYYVQFDLPDGYEFSPMDQTDDELDSDANPSDGMTDCFDIADGIDNPDIDAGMYAHTDSGCTRSKGFWKNHTGLGPQADMVSEWLPIWLGGDDTAGSGMSVTDVQMTYEILQQHTYGHPSNGITKLYAQLLAAKLNIASGANDRDVSDIISDADDFLAEHDFESWDDLSKDERQMVNDWKSTLDDYNNGLIGPGHCDDQEDDMDDDGDGDDN